MLHREAEVLSEESPRGRDPRPGAGRRGGSSRSWGLGRDLRAARRASLRGCGSGSTSGTGSGARTTSPGSRPRPSAPASTRSGSPRRRARTRPCSSPRSMRTERIGIGPGILQLPARTPAATAMAAITLDHLSRGRLRLGLGVSGPQVAEGWHGVPFDHPIGRTRSTSRSSAASSDGTSRSRRTGRTIRCRCGGSSKPLKANVRPLRADVPIFLAAMGPRNVALAAEIADRWIPFLYSPERAEVFAPSLAEDRGGAIRPRVPRRRPHGAARDRAGSDRVPRPPAPAPRLLRRGDGIARGELLQGPRDRVRFRRRRGDDPGGLDGRRPRRQGSSPTR